MESELSTWTVGFQRRRALGALIAAMGAVVSILVGSVAASANNDPHRTLSPQAAFDLPIGYCAFPVHLDFPVDREYATTSTLADGSTVLTVTGSLVASVTNLTSGRAVQVNASGPGIVTISPDGSTGHFDVRGLFLLFASNATAFGFPSNLVLTTGQWSFNSDFATNAMSQPSTEPHVLLDVCAALS